MKIKIFSILFFLTAFSVSAQIKGVVKDSITGQPIPYVSIWVQNENYGSTTEENGTFSINVSEKSKNLIFSALGYEKKIVKIAEVREVNLVQTTYQLDEIIISNRKEKREIEIGQTDNAILEAFDNGPRIDTKFFPYYASYKKTRFIKKITIFTDSKIDNASIKIHFYKVDSNGFPADEILDKNLIVSVGKGVNKTAFNVTKFNLKMPLEGLFVGFEKLIIESNKFEKSMLDKNTNTLQTLRTYYPFVLYNFVEKDFLYTFSGGKWSRQTNQSDGNSQNKIMIYEPAINLILTN
ncbi:carboxypeptidase-like regulatory domain-containing protein [Flavobacterium luteum]|uniref:Carboxypeptidase-like regulatory domain-containing protein n=1 Tax=Flavobacterium luteum TaxID=2026654 RepID=A0A7J5AI40_9FLAO|nr:carboxypeptidase-like regulatory domain-containing protein [Flavobacterium luteum]KAB1157068.1 carboxypeptidase-like regulatory domain-containing protein [Flavobacterium luteum]